MTREEVAALIEQIPQGIHVDEFIVMLATKAAEYEREQCAKVCDAQAGGRRALEHYAALTYSGAANDCAGAIRSRK